MKTFLTHHNAGLRRILISILFLCVCSISAPAYAMEPWVGIFFSPQANTNNSHTAYMTDFEAMVKTLKAMGHNTIVFDMNYGAYHFTSDSRLNRYFYPANKGFTSAEAHRMAEIVRANGMQVMVALQVLTHSVGNVFSEVYPEYMLPGKAWQQGTAYSATRDYVQFNSRTYRCITSHTASAGNAPPAKGYWLAAASDTRDPFNSAGEAVVFKMVDELISAFTVNGVKPEGFHIGCDELGWWYDNPEQATGKSSAQIYAMAITNACNHIRQINPTMEVVMWGDMLDSHWFGTPDTKNTAAAIDLIPKDLIIADWRYDTSQTIRYDSVKATYLSVGEYLDKGFRVWPTSWSDVKATTDLVWTGNIEQGRTGKVMGHLYSTWFGGVVPGLKAMFDDPDYQIPDSLLPGISDTDKPSFRLAYRSLADSIKTTSNLIGSKQCRGSKFHCGVYPNCLDSTLNDGFYGGDYRSYFCNNNVSAYNVIAFPKDDVGYWKFDGDAGDAFGRYPGTLQSGATIVKDAARGNVANFATANARVRVNNNEKLNMGTGSLSISVWFKAGASSELGTIVSKNPELTNYTLFLHTDGRIVLETNSNSFSRYSTNGINYRDNKWHHVVAIFDSSMPTIDLYVDAVLSNGVSGFSNGSNIKSSTTDLSIGNNNASIQYQFYGYLDDLMLFNRALSPEEVKLIYTMQTALPAPTKLKGKGAR